jgi:hypothetical protein
MDDPARHSLLTLSSFFFFFFFLLFIEFNWIFLCYIQLHQVEKMGAVGRRGLLANSGTEL